jgi:CMP-N,N'-diacetyllegionaminic acid synthase
MKVYAIIPARSGSKGLPDKNIRKLCGHNLIGYSIAFARNLGVDKVICSTDSSHYAEIAIKYGAEVPFLRSSWAAGDKAMEQDILKDIHDKFITENIPIPDLIVWLRPTFVYRDAASVKECIKKMVNFPNLTACRVVVSAESRLYRINDGILEANFPTNGDSMVRRQDVGTAYRVFCTDVFRGGKYCSDFLGNKVGSVVADKICGIDIDDEFDFSVAEAVMRNMGSAIKPYLSLSPIFS